MEPLEDIPFSDFFCYKDDKGFTYGFNINSLYALFKSNQNITNPYNREKMESYTFNQIIKLLRLNNILFKQKYDGLLDIHFNVSRNSNQNSNEIYYLSNRNTTIQKLLRIKQHTLQNRTEQVFIEIDLLGNYTQGSWFSSLNEHECLVFIQYLYDIWNYRANMSDTTRTQICPFFNPFYFRIYNRNLNMRGFHKDNAITIIENIVFSGGDIESRKIGVIHILTALTIVSLDARNTMPWLYESVEIL
jgi:hypothetical protein